VEKKEEVVKTINNVIDSEKIIEVINEIVDAKVIYIFGSYAKGQQRNDSDIDIYIVVNSLNGRVIEILSQIRVALMHIVDKPMDILLSTTEMFEERKTFKSSIERVINKEGVAIYG